MEVSSQLNVQAVLPQGNILSYALIGGYANSESFSTLLIRNEVIAYV